MFSYIISKLLAESLLSLYPVFVKKINLPLITQLWSRFITYFIISCFFVSWNFILKNIFTKYGIQLFIITMIHVYTSYRAFQILDSGISFVLFYTYPIMILLLAGKGFNPIMLFALLGVYLLSNNNLLTSSNNYKENDNKNKETDNKDSEKETFKYEGLIMILLAALTEAMIYFIVRNIKTDNHWNHLLLSYGGGAIILSIYLLYKYINTDSNIESYEINIKNNNLYISLIINGCIGLFGYLLRFYAMSHLNPSIYAPLSYFGIIMAFVYGITLNNETINIQKIIGSLLIIISSIITSKLY